MAVVGFSNFMLCYSHQRTRGACTMSERDGFQPGVPSWVDVMGPDADRLTDFYGAIFGWDFTGPGAMPGDPPGEYFVAQLRGRDVAGVGSLPPEAEARARAAIRPPARRTPGRRRRVAIPEPG